MHAVRIFPCAYEGRHDAKHTNFRILDKNAKLATCRHAIIQSNGGFVNETGVNEPWTHHPTEICIPCKYVPRMDVVV